MNSPQQEQVGVHIQLLKCGLEVENSRAYWAHADGVVAASTQRAFDGYWFGARSLPRITLLLSNFRARFDAFPDALHVLRHWRDMPPGTRRLVCHWHLQLADCLYRAFTGEFLPERRAGHRPEVTRNLAVDWVREHGPARWQMPTRIRFAGNLLSAAHAAGLLGSKRDPRPVLAPSVEDDALHYLLHLLRSVAFSGSLAENPYLRSVGLTGTRLEDRLRGTGAVQMRRLGDLADFEWGHDGLLDWATGTGKMDADAARGAAG